jgi:hypothetical protein
MKVAFTMFYLLTDPLVIETVLIDRHLKDFESGYFLIHLYICQGKDFSQKHNDYIQRDV